MEGDNITITTEAEHKVVSAPDIQYDTSDAELAGTVVKAAAAVIGIKALTDSQRVEVVTQPDPVIVTQPQPVIVD